MRMRGWGWEGVIEKGSEFEDRDDEEEEVKEE